MNLLKRYPYKSPMTASRVINGQAIVIFMGEGKDRESKINVFNDTGSYVWTILNGRRSVGEIVDLIIREYDVSCEKAKKKIVKFILNLSERKLIIISATPQ